MESYKTSNNDLFFVDHNDNDKDWKVSTHSGWPIKKVKYYDVRATI